MRRGLVVLLAAMSLVSGGASGGVAAPRDVAPTPAGDSCEVSLVTVALGERCQVSIPEPERVDTVFAIEVDWDEFATGIAAVTVREQSTDIIKALLRFEVRAGAPVRGSGSCTWRCFYNYNREGTDSVSVTVFSWVEAAAIVELEVYPYGCWYCPGTSLPGGTFSITVAETPDPLR